MAERYKLKIFCQHCVDEYFHRVTLSSLASGEVYSYQIDGEDTVRTFRAKNVSNAWAPTFAVFGDMGTEVGPDKTISPSIALLAKEAAAGTIDGVLHVGDFAYNFWEDGGKKGDVFMNQIQDVASRVPYMTCPGNHEAGTNFAGDLPLHQTLQPAWWHKRCVFFLRYRPCSHRLFLLRGLLLADLGN